MKKITVYLMLIALAALLSASCNRQDERRAGEVQTGTFARPEPQPGEIGTDALSQTVELEDGRSENEGGAITTPNPPVRVGSPIPRPDTTGTTTTTTQTTAPPPPRRQ